MTKKTSETFTIPNVAANTVFNRVGMVNPANEIPEIPGFTNPETYGDSREARKGRIPSIFMITRMSDGKMFGAQFDESADDNFYAESPFHPQTKGQTMFREIQKKTRVITEEYVEFA